MTPADRIAYLEVKLSQIYQAVGILLDEADRFDSEEGQRLLDFISRDVDVDLLPWPREND